MLKISDTIYDVKAYDNEIALLLKEIAQYKSTLTHCNKTLSNSASYHGRTDISFQTKLANRLKLSLKNYDIFTKEYMPDIEESYAKNKQAIKTFALPFKLYENNLNGKNKKKLDAFEQVCCRSLIKVQNSRKWLFKIMETFKKELNKHTVRDAFLVRSLNGELISELSHYTRGVETEIQLETANVEEIGNMFTKLKELDEIVQNEVTNWPSTRYDALGSDTGMATESRSRTTSYRNSV